MTILRQFIIAPTLARLIRKERGRERVLKGDFPDQPQRRTYVQVEETRSSLILEAGEGAAPDEQADVPLAHAQALLAVSHGQGKSVRTKRSIISHEMQALPFVRPGPRDLVAIAGAPEIEFTDAALNSLLDLLEDRFHDLASATASRGIGRTGDSCPRARNRNGSRDRCPRHRGCGHSRAGLYSAAAARRISRGIFDRIRSGAYFVSQSLDRTLNPG